MTDVTLLAIGCYTERMAHVDGKGKGVQVFALDRWTGALDLRHVLGNVRNPSYLAINPAGDRLYAVEELDAAANPQLVTYALAGGALTELARVPLAGSAACHVYVTADAGALFVSNFVSGDLLAFQLRDDGTPRGSAQLIDRGDKANVHCAIEAPDGSVVLVCDAGNDTVAGYVRTGTGLETTPRFELKTTAGNFPRHVATTPGQATILLANELASTLATFRVTDGKAERGVEISTLPAGWSEKSYGAAVRYHPNGRWAYASNRGHDSIFGASVDHGDMSLAPIGIWPSGGKFPRDFAIDPSGHWLVASHQNSDNLTSFAIDQATGALTATGHSVSTGTPVSVLFLG